MSLHRLSKMLLVCAASADLPPGAASSERFILQIYLLFENIYGNKYLKKTLFDFFYAFQMRMSGLQ
jgi:hypothetical protein